MAFTPISNTVPQYEENGVAASGYFIKFYESGTTTPTAMATDSTGTTLLDKCELNTEGYPINGSSAVFIPHINKKYKIALFRNAADADANDLASAAWPVVDGLLPVLSEGDGQVDTIANLRLLKPSFDGQQVELLGHTLAGIGGGGFYYDASDTTTADNNGTIIVTSSGERWKRGYDLEINPTMFGADSNGILDSTIAFQNALDANGHVKTKKGETYLLSGIEISDSYIIEGDGLLQSKGDNHLIIANGASGFSITVNANGAGANYSGLLITGCTDFSVSGCSLDSFGETIGFQSAIKIEGVSRRFSIVNNTCINGLGDTAADISLGHDPSEAIVSGNRCLSPNSEGITIQPTTGDKIVRATVSNNLCSGHTRHGIIGVYANDKPVEVSITGNVCVNNGWTGIYMQGQLAGVGTNSGRATISGNIVSECGGDDTSLLFNSGIYLAGDLGYTCFGNMIVNTCRDKLGVEKSMIGRGIFISNLSNAVVTSNVVTNTFGSGIFGDGSKLDGLIIGDNIVKDSTITNIRLEIQGAGNISKLVNIHDNMLKSSEYDCAGIRLSTTSTAEWRGFSIKGNKIQGEKLSTNEKGIEITAATNALLSGEILYNEITNYDFGVYKEGAQSHLYGVKGLVIKDNIFRFCGNALTIQSGSSNWSIVDKQIFESCDVDFNGTWQKRGTITASGNALLFDTSKPAFAAWAAGDKVENTNPSSSGYAGWVCVSSGTPGTWKGYGLIES